MKYLIPIVFIAFATSAQAKTVSCFTKFFGASSDSSLSIVLKVNPSLGFQTKSVLIEGESLKIDQRHKKGNVVSSKGKYAGMLRFDLGLFQLLGDYFSLELTIPNQPSEKLSGFVMFKDAQGGSKYNLVCDAR